MPVPPHLQALNQALYDEQDALGLFDPDNPENSGISWWDRHVAEFGRGMDRGLTLGIGGGMTGEAHSQELDLSGDDGSKFFDLNDTTDVAALLGDIVGSLPAAMVSGGIGLGIARAVAPRLAARAGLAGMLGRGAAAAVKGAAPGASIGTRLATAAGRNVIEGAAVNTAQAVGELATADDASDGLQRAGLTGALNLGIDLTVGGAFGIRKPKTPLGTAGDLTEVTIGPDVHTMPGHSELAQGAAARSAAEEAAAAVPEPATPLGATEPLQLTAGSPVDPMAGTRPAPDVAAPEGTTFIAGRGQPEYASRLITLLHQIGRTGGSELIEHPNGKPIVDALVERGFVARDAEGRLALTDAAQQGLAAWSATGAAPVVPAARRIPAQVGPIAPPAPAGSIADPSTFDVAPQPMAVTAVRRTPLGEDAPVGATVRGVDSPMAGAERQSAPADPELAAKAEGQRAPVLDPQEQAVVSTVLGIQEQAAAAAMPQGAFPVPRGASKGLQQVSLEAAKAWDDPVGMAGLLANLQGGVYPLKPGEGDYLLQQLAPRAQELAQAASTQPRGGGFAERAAARDAERQAERAAAATPLGVAEEPSLGMHEQGDLAERAGDRRGEAMPGGDEPALEGPGVLSSPQGIRAAVGSTADPVVAVLPNGERIPLAGNPMFRMNATGHLTEPDGGMIDPAAVARIETADGRVLWVGESDPGSTPLGGAPPRPTEAVPAAAADGEVASAATAREKRIREIKAELARPGPDPSALSESKYRARADERGRLAGELTALEREADLEARPLDDRIAELERTAKQARSALAADADEQGPLTPIRRRMLNAVAEGAEMDLQALRGGQHAPVTAKTAKAEAPRLAAERDRTTVLVACGAEKGAARTTAAELYTGDLFRKARAVAEQIGRSWKILSAKHGAVEPSAELDPYNVALGDMSPRQRQTWAAKVFDSIKGQLEPGSRVVILGGENYRRDLVPLLEAHGVEVEVPLRNQGIGQQKQTLAAIRAALDDASETAPKIERVAAEDGTVAHGVSEKEPVPAVPSIAEKAAEAQADATGPVPLGERTAGADGRSYTLRFSDGGTAKARYRVVELDDLQASHSGQTFEKNPAYPEGVQGRDYHRDRAAQESVAGQTAGFDPEVPLSVSPVPNVGPTGVRPDGTVIWGHGRKMLLDRIYADAPEKAAAYRAALEERAGAYGIDPEAVRGMRRPVLVAEVVDEALDLTDRNVLRELNTRSDQDVGKTKDALSDANTRARQLRQGQALQHYASTISGDQSLRDYMGTAAGRQFAKELIADGVITRAESARLLDQGTGTLTPEGVDLVERVMLATAIGDPDVVAAMPAGLRAQLEGAIPAMVKAQGLDGWDISPILREAVKLHVESRAAGASSIRNLIEDQGGLFGRGDDPRAVQLAEFLQAANRKQTTEAFRGYAVDADSGAKMAATESLFGEAPPTADDAFQKWFGDGFGRAVQNGKITDALDRLATQKGGIPAALRKVMERHLGVKGGEFGDRELVELYKRRGAVDDSAFQAMRRAVEEWGFAFYGGNLLIDPLMGMALGTLGGSAIGGALGGEEGAAFGAGVGAVAGYGGGAKASRMITDRVAGRVQAKKAFDSRVGREFSEELAVRRDAGELDGESFMRLSGDDERLQAAPPGRIQQAAREDGRIGFPLPPRTEPRGRGGRLGNRGEALLAEVAEPRVVLEERPRALGGFEKWLRSPRDLFAKFSKPAAEIADEGARAVDLRNTFLDLRKQQIGGIFSTLTKGKTRAEGKALKASLWKALDRYALVSDVPMTVPSGVRDAFLEFRKVFRDDVLRLFEMKRDLLGATDRKALDTALEKGMRESSLPEDFPEHLRPLVAMKTGEWGIAAYWPHVFDGNWKVHAGPHTNYFSSRNEAEKYAQRLLEDGKFAEDIAVTHELSVTPDMATVLPRERYWKLVGELRASLGLDPGSVVSKTQGIVRPGPKKRFLAHEHGRKINLQTFETDPEQALELYYHRWATKLAFDPFRVRSAELLGETDGKIVGLRDELEDYIRRVQGLPSSNELAFEASVRDGLLWLTRGLVETKPFLARRVARRANEISAFAKLGFSPVSAALNLTQTVINTAPAVGEKWALKGVREALAFRKAQLTGGRVDPRLEAMLRETGALTLHPKHLVGELDRVAGSGIWSQVSQVSMYMFDKAENANRMVAAISMFRKAEAEGASFTEAVARTREFLRETQFRYDAADAPKLAANPLGKVLLQFQTYAIKEVEFMAKLAKRDPKAFGKAISYFAALAGVRGVLVGTPIWMLDALAGQMGLFEEDGVKKRPSELAAEHLPDFLTFGALGSILTSDVSERTGVGTAREFTDSHTGPSVGILRDLYQAQAAYREGDTDRATFFMRRALPAFMGRLMNAHDVLQTGELRDSWGRTVRRSSGAGDVARTGLGLRGFESTREWDRESQLRRDQEAKDRRANRFRNRAFDALDAGDVGGAVDAAQEAMEAGVSLDPDQLRRGYQERRNPELRKLRRTRAMDRRRLLDTETIRNPTDF